MFSRYNTNEWRRHHSSFYLWMRSSCGFFFVTRCYCYCCCCWCWIKHKKISKNSTISLTHYLSCLGKEKKFHQKNLKVTFEPKNGLYVYYLSFDTSARFISHSALSRHWSCSDFRPVIIFEFVSSSGLVKTLVWKTFHVKMIFGIEFCQVIWIK